MLMKLTLVFLLFFGLFAKAEPPKELTKDIIGQNKYWTALKSYPNGKKTCYAISYPISSIGNQKKREELPYIMVHYFGIEKFRFSAYLGYDLTQNRAVNLSIDSTQHQIQASSQYAIAQNFNQDFKLLEGIKKGTKLLIRGEGKDFSYSVDEYSLIGFMEMFEIMQKHCNFNKNKSSFETVVPNKSHLKQIDKQ